jgi:hypothetical protein
VVIAVSLLCGPATTSPALRCASGPRLPVVGTLRSIRVERRASRHRPVHRRHPDAPRREAPTLPPGEPSAGLNACHRGRHTRLSLRIHPGRQSRRALRFRRLGGARGSQSGALDVAVFGRDDDGRETLLAIGEAKASSAMDLHHLARLDHIRGLLRACGSVPDERTRLFCFSGAGFSADLRRVAARDTTVHLVDLDRLYHGE